MRILALVTDAFGGGGGIAQSSRDLFCALTEKIPSLQITILPRLAKDKIQEIPSGIRQKSPSRNRMLYILRALWTLWRDGPFDVIFCGHLFMAPLAFIFSRCVKLPCWFHLYGIEAWEKPSRLVCWSVERASLVTVISRYTRRKFLSWANLTPERVRILPVTVSENFMPGPKPEYLLNRFGLREKKILLTVGRLSSQERYKGHDRMIDLMLMLREKYSDLVYVIAGEGDDRERLEQKTRERGLMGVVRFVGYVNHSELPDLYRMADYFVMPSRGEGFGIVFLEAMACGIPAIGLNVDGSSDPLQDGLLGYMLNDSEFDNELNQILKNFKRPDAGLSERVHLFFGGKACSAHVKKVFRSLFKDNQVSKGVL